MELLFLAGAIAIAYYIGKSAGYEKGKKQSQQFTIEVKKK